MTTATELDTLRRAQRAVNGAMSMTAQLRRENRMLRRQLAHNGRYGRLLRRAHDDALTLLLWRHGGWYPSRTWAGEQGMSERRWTWARGLLMAARLWDGDDVAPVDLDVAKRRLQATVDRMQAADDDKLEALRARMPRKYRYAAD